MLTAVDLLLNRRAHVFAPLAMRARNDMDFAGVASTRRKRWSVRSLDRSISGRLFDSLFLFVSMAGHCRISLDETGRARTTASGDMCTFDRYAHPSMVPKTAGESQ